MRSRQESEGEMREVREVEHGRSWDDVQAEWLEQRTGVTLPPLRLPAAVLRAAGLHLAIDDPVAFAARVWQGESWGPQTALGVLAQGTLPGGRGAPGYTASAARCVSTPAAKELWAAPEVSGVLANGAYRGLVWALLTSDGSLCSVVAAPPAGALFAALEGVEDRASWLRDPTTPLYETWTCSLLVSRWPWPAESGDTVEIPRLEDRASKHFWGPQGVLTRDTLLGCATAWSERLGDCVGRAAHTAMSVAVPTLQWRLGAHKDLLERWGMLMDLGLVE